MRSLVRWGAALGLAGGVLAGSMMAVAPQAMALPKEQVVERLSHVPVFTLTDAQGSPLVAARPQGQQGPPVAGVFISRQDAEQFLENLRRNNRQLADSVRVTPVSLGEIYELALQNESQQNGLKFAFVPMQQEVQTAMTLLRQGGQTIERFDGVPLFIARSQGQQGGYLTIQQNNQQVVPLFFRRDELQAMLDRLRQQQPNLASQVNIQVTSLEGVIQTLQTQNTAELNQILLIPPRESIEYVRTLETQQGQQRPNLPAGQQQPAGAGQPAQTQQRPAQPAPQTQQRPAQPR
jgi:hypothetical protein